MDLSESHENPCVPVSLITIKFYYNILDTERFYFVDMTIVLISH